MSQIIKIIDERARQNKKNKERKKENKDREKKRTGASYSESVRANWFFCAFKFKHLIQLILYENDVKLLKFKKSPVQVDL